MTKTLIQRKRKEKISWTEPIVITNEEVLATIGEERALME